jgi:hypothetical protein
MECLYGYFVGKLKKNSSVHTGPGDGCRVARFFLMHDTKAGKMYQMNTKRSKSSRNIPNVRKVLQTATNYSNILPSWYVRSSKFFPNLDFWFENKSSGNPGWFGSKKI